MAGTPILPSMNQRQLYLAAYDISDPGRLRRGLKVLRRYASGGQKSVFECFLSATEKAALLHAIDAVIEPTEDRFFLVRLDRQSKVQALGIAVRPLDPPYFLVS